MNITFEGFKESLNEGSEEKKIKKNLEKARDIISSQMFITDIDEDLSSVMTSLDKIIDKLR